MIMEAEKSQNLPLVSWRPRKARITVQSKSKDLKILESWCKFLSKSEVPVSQQEKMSYQLSSQAGKANSPFLDWLLLVLFRSSTDWMMLIHNQKANPLHSVYQFKCWSHQAASPQTSLEMFTQISGHPMALSSWHTALFNPVICYCNY